MPMCRRRVLSTACAYGTFFLVHAHGLEVFHFSFTGFGHLLLSSFSSVVSSLNSSPYQVCNRLLWIFVYLIFCAWVICLAKHGRRTCAVLNLHVCFPCWMLPADRTSPVHVLCNVQRAHEHSHGRLSRCPNRHMSKSTTCTLFVSSNLIPRACSQPQTISATRVQNTYCTKSDPDTFSSRC